jgi:hypothetical protein
MKKSCSYPHRFYLLLVLTFLCLGLQATDLKKIFTPGQIERANTGKEARFMSAVEKETLTLINLARLYPKQFLKLYMDYAGKKAVNGNSYYTSLTKELKAMEPCNELLPDKVMYELAKCWATEAGKQGMVGHNRKNCTGSYNGECCSYGSAAGTDIVMQLLIDDGVKSLGHRRICLDKNYRLVGISVQPHKTYGTNAVLDFTYNKSDNTFSKASAQKEIKKTTSKQKAIQKTTVKKKTMKSDFSSKIAVKKSNAKRTVRKPATAKECSQKIAAKRLVKN